MLAKITVKPGRIILNDGSTFLVTSADGAIDENQAEGLFVQDTRLISHYELTLNRHRLLLLASSNITHHSALYVYTNSELETLKGILPKNCLVVSQQRDLVNCMHEDIDITNWHEEQVMFQMVLSIRSDFADIFQVKSKQLLIRGHIETTWQDGKLTVQYHSGESFHRGLIITTNNASSPPHNANGRLVFDIALEPGESWHLGLNYTALVDGKEFKPPEVYSLDHTTEAGKERNAFIEKAMRIQSSNADVVACYQQALMDIGALQIKVEDKGNQLWMPAGGIPWFMTVFGRDSLIVSLQSLSVYHQFASATVVRLAQLQANKVDDWRDAQPGKMPHELRCGELAQLHVLPYTPYYGTVDATILWIITLAAAYSWNADAGMLDECQPSLKKALDWIDNYGDFDGDGFVEYLSRSQSGARNQGWKDSGKAIIYPNGELVDPPIALCEVQGEVYKAWKEAAELYERWGEKARATQLRQKANDLYQRFNERFWMESEEFYCLGLDSHKQQIRTITSNPGQLLWTGIVPEERAHKIAQRLFQADMWCGWGIRTLSSKNRGYNPISYQRGSVWPFDNSLIAYGLKKYGYFQEANQIAEGIFTAAKYFDGGRLPEVFGGIERRPNNFPVPYIDANIPQGWSSGAIFLFINAILGLEPDAVRQRLKVYPTLPDWLPDLELTNLTVRDAKVALRFWREGEQTRWEVTHIEGELQVEANG
ncbi:glycogen debranching N-terminal domain-containing protein [Nitrosococcus watsonii]|uniref:Amylo-alpha-16-glucosidase n=1 Tax=Nitrosococcus watsoni (strain C-113) TaxID=105559 RepID=D8KBL2_NITWC|nr:glycogen debranching N-terminal domain-containing protein [Nitrosococcus watsonii]ADJ29659.1 Amylo-alpha-16-glucosidase [Nitrosococcus watsonii C-113]